MLKYLILPKSTSLNVLFLFQSYYWKMEIVERHTPPILNNIGASSANAQRDFFSGLSFGSDIYGLYPTEKPLYPTDRPTVTIILVFEYGFQFKIQVQ